MLLGTSCPSTGVGFLPNKHGPDSPGPLFHSEELDRKEPALQSMGPGFHLATSKLGFGKLKICQHWSLCVFRKLPIVASCYHWPGLQSPSMELCPTLPPSPEGLLGTNKGVKTRATSLLLNSEQVGKPVAHLCGLWKANFSPSSLSGGGAYREGSVLGQSWLHLSLSFSSSFVCFLR